MDRRPHYLVEIKGLSNESMTMGLEASLRSSSKATCQVAAGSPNEIRGTGGRPSTDAAYLIGN